MAHAFQGYPGDSDHLLHVLSSRRLSAAVRLQEWAGCKVRGSIAPQKILASHSLRRNLSLIRSLKDHISTRILFPGSNAQDRGAQARRDATVQGNADKSQPPYQNFQTDSRLPPTDVNGSICVFAPEDRNTQNCHSRCVLSYS